MVAAPDKTLMLVEDEAIIALTEKQLLTRAGYGVVLAHSGESAIDLIRNDNGAIDLVLMDIDLGPGIDGTTAAKQILQVRDIPLVFLSSHTEKDYTERAENITSYGYVVKNTGETVLLASIKMAFRLHAANEALRERESRFRLIAEHARDLVYRVDLLPERHFSYVSPAATRITGYTPEEHYANPDLGFELVHPDDRPRLNALMQRADAFAAPIVLRWRRKDGRLIWTEQTNTPIVDAEGRLIAIEGIARDVTERKQLEERLQQSNERLAAFLRISREVTHAKELGELLQLVVDSAAQVTELTSNAIYLCHGETIELRATTPAIPADFPAEYRVAPLSDHPHIRRAITTASAVLIPDTATATFTPAERGVVTNRDLRSILYLPIRLDGIAIGVLILSSTGKPHSFCDEEVLLLQEFADQAARLIDKTQGMGCA